MGVLGTHEVNIIICSVVCVLLVQELSEDITILLDFLILTAVKMSMLLLLWVLTLRVKRRHNQ
jgi:hypothetical protein